MNLSINETLNMTIGQFNSMLACHSIYNGKAKPSRKHMDIFDVLAMR